jgi:hypothetical protein
MEDTVADGQQSNQERGSGVDVSAVPPGEQGPPLAVAPGSDDRRPTVPDRSGAPAGHPLEPFRIHDLLLLESHRGNPVEIDTLSFDEEGIGVIRSRGDRPRVLPWASVLTQVVEPWQGGIAPEWWVDPELNRSESMEKSLGSVTDPGATSRSLPHVEPGAVIAVRTASGTFRFLLPGGDPRTLAREISAIAVRKRGPSAASSATRVVAWGEDVERRKVERKPSRRLTWSRVQPFLVVALILFIATAVTLILLQSAGVVHLPYLGGNGSGATASALHRID